jgi:hypothetical protein
MQTERACRTKTQTQPVDCRALASAVLEPTNLVCSAQNAHRDFRQVPSGAQSTGPNVMYLPQLAHAAVQANTTAPGGRVWTVRRGCTMMT